MTLQIQSAFSDESKEYSTRNPAQHTVTNSTLPPDEDEDDARHAPHSYLDILRLFVASCVVMALVAVAFTGISNQWCVLHLPPAALFIILAGCIILLAYVEALHYACVCVEKWDMTEYQESHPRAYKCYLLIDTPDKVKKFLVGRQFFVIFVVFLIAQITSFPGIPVDFLGMPPIMVTVLVKTGLPGVAITLTFGQLISQIYVEEYTIPFLNLLGCEFIIRLSLWTEYIGVCNFSWLLYYGASFLGCRRASAGAGAGAGGHAGSSESNMESNSDGPMSPTAVIRGPSYVHLSALDQDQPSLSAFDVFKYIWSSAASLSAVLIILYGISLQAYVLPTPVAATYIIFFAVLTLLFYLEGLMIAVVATQYWDKETFKEAYPRAYMLHEVINRPNNVKRFIIGRQFCTVLTGFILAQITTFEGWEHGSLNPIGFYIVVQSGLVGVLTVLAFGQLMPELLAQEYPLRFMNMYGAYSVSRICLFFDTLCVGHCAWAIYFATRHLLCVVDKKGKTGPVVRMNSGDVNGGGLDSPKKVATTGLTLTIPRV